MGRVQNSCSDIYASPSEVVYCITRAIGSSHVLSRVQLELYRRHGPTDTVSQLATVCLTLITMRIMDEHANAASRRRANIVALLSRPARDLLLCYVLTRQEI